MYTHICFVLDSSGSMNEIVEDTRGGFNSFLDDHRDGNGEATVTLYDFNSNVEKLYEGYPVVEAPELDEDNYTPGGRTALHDAIVRAVDETAEYTGDMNPEDQPDNVVIVVLTDGKENASETPKDAVKGRVEHRRETDDWEFMFIGANQDAVLTGEGMGIDTDKSLTMAHDGDGAREAYQSTSESIAQTRREGVSDGFSDEDRNKQKRSED